MAPIGPELGLGGSVQALEALSMWLTRVEPLPRKPLDFVLDDKGKVGSPTSMHGNTPHLWGIDDPIIEKSILREALKRNRARRWRNIALLCFGCGALMGVLTGLTESLLGLPGRWPGHLSGAITGVLAAVLIARSDNRHLRRHLPEVLRERGRCERCGYHLSPPAEKRCPECGFDALNRVK